MEAPCYEGSRVLSGGGYWHDGSGNPTPATSEGTFGGTSARADDGHGWFAHGYNFAGGSLFFSVQALCVK